MFPETEGPNIDPNVLWTLGGFMGFALLGVSNNYGPLFRSLHNMGYSILELLESR